MMRKQTPTQADSVAARRLGGHVGGDVGCEVANKRYTTGCQVGARGLYFHVQRRAVSKRSAGVRVGLCRYQSQLSIVFLNAASGHVPKPAPERLGVNRLTVGCQSPEGGERIVVNP